MKLIQMTDIHLTTPGETIGGRDPNANFVRALHDIVEQHRDAEAIIITGDLSDWGVEADYERLKAHLKEVPIPVHLAIGNHDDRATFLSVFPDLSDENGFVQKSFSLSGGTGVIIDTCGLQSHAGFFCETRVAWLEKTMRNTEGPVFLFMHHNPIPTHFAPLDKIMLQDDEAFAAVVKRHRDKLAHIVFGHCHLPLAGSLHGVPVSAPRGTNHAGWVNASEVEMLLGSDLPHSYAVITVQNVAVTVRMAEFGYGGPIRIEGSPDYATWDRSQTNR